MKNQVVPPKQPAKGRASLAALLLPLTLGAADCAAADVDEVLVTARRRAEPLATTPVSARVFSREELAALQPANVVDLARGMVGVRLDPVGPQGRSGQFAIRGINYGSTNQAGDPSVPLYVDGVYQSRSNLAVLHQFDLQSAEIVRGAQVTHLGRNAFAGAVTLTTRQPGDAARRELEVGFGSGGLQRWLAAIDVPLAGPDVALRLAVTGTRASGIYRSSSAPRQRLGGEDFLASRLTVSLRPAEDWLVTLKLESLRDRGEPSPVHNASTTPSMATSQLAAQALGSVPTVPPNYFTAPRFHTEVFKPAGQRSHVDQDSLTLMTSVPVGSGTLDFIGAYQRTDDSVIVDPAGIGARAYNNQYFVTDVRMGSQELRWLGELHERWQLLLGFHHLQDDMSYGNITLSDYAPLAGANAQVLAGQERRSTAVFAEMEWRPTTTWRANLAGRFMREGKTFRFARTARPPNPSTLPAVFLTPGVYATRSATWDNFSPKLSVDYRTRTAGLWFASWTRGFKSGGYAVQVPSIAFAGPFDPERVETIETGWRHASPSRQWQSSITLFHNRIHDLQRNVNKTNGGVLGNLVVNAAAAETYGIETELVWRPTENQSWQLAATRLEARYLSYCANTGFPGGLSGVPRGAACGTTAGEVDNSRFPMANAPEWQSHLGWKLSLPSALGPFEFSTQLIHTGALFTTDVPFPISRRRPMTLLDAGMAWRAQGLRWRLDVRNVVNQVATLQGIRSGNTLTVLALTPPRSVVLSAAFDF